MKERKFTVKNRSNERLVCIEILPTENPTIPLPAVILCHGFAWFKEEDGIFTELAQRLAKLGYVVYYFDFSGCGESEGDYQQTTLTKLVADLNVIWQEVSGYKYVDAKRLSLVGQSFGTNVVIASQLPIERLVLCGSFYNPYALLSGHMDEFNKDGVSSKYRSNGTDTLIGSQFWADFKHYDLEKLVAQYDCPILFIHGDNDRVVPLENAKPLVTAAKQGALHVIRDADHGLRPNLDGALNAITQFFVS